MDPIVSVIIPVYNAQEYLRICLDSVLGQTLRKTEIICVDAGSTDQSLKILEEYAARDERIQIAAQGRLTAGAARNLGLRMARGKYLSFLDADDFFESDMLQLAAEKAECENSDMVVFEFCNFDHRTGGSEKEPRGLRMDMVPLRCPFSAEDIPGSIFTFTNIAVWNKIYRREFVLSNQVEFQDLKNSNDLYFAVTALALAERISIMENCFVSYRVNNPLSLQGNRDDCPLEFAHALEAVYERLMRDERRGLFERSLVNFCLSVGLIKLRACSQASTFRMIFCYLRDRLFELYKMKEYEPYYFYSRDEYEDLKEIVRRPAEEYLFYRWKQDKRQPVEFREVQYLFPFTLADRGSRVVIYAAGRLGRAYIDLIKRTGYCDLVLWVDRDSALLRRGGLNVAPVGRIHQVDFDFAIIAVLDKVLAINIKAELMAEGIPERKILWQDERMSDWQV